MEQFSNLKVSETLAKEMECVWCNYVEGCAEGTLYCVPAGQIIPRPIPGWCPLKYELYAKLAKQDKLTWGLKWKDYKEDDRLHSSYMGYKVFSMVVQQPDQRPGAPYKEGPWMLTSDIMGLLRYTLKATTGEEAKKEAIQIAREKLRESMKQLRDMIVEIEQRFTDDPDIHGMYDGALATVW